MVRPIIDQLIINQRPIVKINKLKYKDLLRISSHIKTSPFNKLKCCLWDNEKHLRYIGINFNKKKHTMTRLMYSNYVGDIDRSIYINQSCENKSCININHLVKKQLKKGKDKILPITVKKKISLTISFD